jgi:hypothetical protein
MVVTQHLICHAAGNALQNAHPPGVISPRSRSGTRTRASVGARHINAGWLRLLEGDSFGSIAEVVGTE